MYGIIILFINFCLCVSVDPPVFSFFLVWNPQASAPITFRLSSVQSHLFLSPIGTRTLKMPVPYSPPNMGDYTRTPSHQPLVFGRRGTDHLP